VQPEPQGASGIMEKMLQLLHGGFNALTSRSGPSSLAPIAQIQAHGVTTNHGDVNIAGRDVHTHKHYHNYSGRAGGTPAAAPGANSEVSPSIAEDFYLRMWHGILEKGPHHALTAKTLLVWVLNASTPLTIEVLEHAVAISPDTHQFDRGRFVPGMILMALCRGLVVFEEESRLVRLVRE
jgi:hypothetical protein